MPKEYQHGPKLKLAPYEKEVRDLVAEHFDAALVVDGAINGGIFFGVGETGVGTNAP